MENLLVKFVQRRRRTVGVVIARTFPELKHVYISGSLCHTSKDTFNKKTAIALAEARATAMAFSARACELPYTLKDEIEYMKDRATRYFKGMDVVVPLIKNI